MLRRVWRGVAVGGVRGLGGVPASWKGRGVAVREPERPFGRPGAASVLGRAPVARRPLGKEERIAAKRNLPLQREPLWRPSAMRYWERALYPVLRAVGGYSKWAQVTRHAEAVFRSVEEQATQDAWFESLGLRRTFMTEQALLTLHVWLCHKRFVLDWDGKGEYDGRVMDRELFNRFWDDTTRRIRNAGVREVSVNKQLETIQKSAFMDMFEYDFALKQEDDNMELAAALFRGVFQGDEDAPLASVIRLADWVRDEVLNIVTQPQEDVYHGWITWSPALGETREERLQRQRAMLEGEWREMIFVDGSLYWYHTKTRQVQRGDVPPKGLYARRRFALAHHMQQLQEQGKIEEGQANPLQLASFAADPTLLQALERFEAEGLEKEHDPRFKVVLPHAPLRQKHQVQQDRVKRLLQAQEGGGAEGGDGGDGGGGERVGERRERE